MYAGETIRERVIFNATVKSVEKIAEQWNIKCAVTPEGDSTLFTRKVIVSTGSTSIPNVPNVVEAAAFKGPIIHTLVFARSNVFENASINSVTIVGDGKSAADMVYQSVKAGKQVNWIVLKSGKGPGSFVAGKSPLGPYPNIPELALTRIFSAIIILSGLGKETWLSTFLLRTGLGSWMHGRLERAVSEQTRQAARYDDRPGARESFKNLNSGINAFFLTASAGMIHHEDFWDAIAQNVDVYREDIDHLGDNSIVLASGNEIQADTILCGTGFKEIFPFFTPKQCVELGLPHAISDEPPEVTKNGRRLPQPPQPKFWTAFPIS